VALTPLGEECLQRNINEFKKLPPHAKLMWKSLFRREVTMKPLCLRVEVRNSNLSYMLNASDVIKKLVEAMKNEGSKVNIDYKVLIVESKVLRNKR